MSRTKTKTSIMIKIGIGIIAFATLVAIFAPVIAPYDPNALGESYLTPSKEHLLGTNDIGQDIFSEIIFGTRVSLLVGFSTAFITMVVGTGLGVSAGYFGKTVDRVITAVTNIAMSIPDLPLTILLVAFMKPSKWNLIIALSITAWTGTARILRAKTREIITQPYIKIEKTLGVSNIIIMTKHILPNLSNILLIRGALSIAGAMVTEAGLSFLGLGTYGEKSWGSILRYAFFRNSILRGQIWWYLPPILCISVTVLGFMLIGYYATEREQ